MTEKKKTGPTVDITQSVSRCPKCLSVKRERYMNVTTNDISGVSPDGRPYDQITWRRTACKNCGQSRVDKEFRFIVEAKSEQVDTADGAPDPFF